MKILYIEDEKRMVETVAEVLRKHNYSVNLAYNGEDGGAFALSELYDIIIFEIEPGVDIGVKLIPHSVSASFIAFHHDCRLS